MKKNQLYSKKKRQENKKQKLGEVVHLAEPVYLLTGESIIRIANEGVNQVHVTWMKIHSRRSQES